MFLNFMNNVIILRIIQVIVENYNFLFQISKRVIYVQENWIFITTFVYKIVLFINFNR